HAARDPAARPSSRPGILQRLAAALGIPFAPSARSEPQAQPPVFKIFRYSSFVGLVAVVAVIVALSWFYRHLAFASLIESETRSNVALTKTFANSIWQSYAHFVRDAARVPPKDLAGRAEVEFMRHDLKNLARDLDVVKVKIYDLNGLTVFSSDVRQIGEDKSGNDGFRRAAAGGVASDITYRDRFDAWEGVINDRSLIGT